MRCEEYVGSVHCDRKPVDTSLLLSVPRVSLEAVTCGFSCACPVPFFLSATSKEPSGLVTGIEGPCRSGCKGVRGTHRGRE